MSISCEHRSPEIAKFWSFWTGISLHRACIFVLREILKSCGLLRHLYKKLHRWMMTGMFLRLNLLQLLYS